MRPWSRLRSALPQRTVLSPKPTSPPRFAVASRAGLLGLLFGLQAPACTEAPATAGSIALSKDRIEFGAIQVGATAYESISVTNVGDGELRLLSVAVVDGDLAIWEVDQQGDSVLAAGASTELTFRFSPIEPGQAEAQVRIRNSSDDQPLADVTLAGATEISNDDLDGDGFSPADGDCDDDNRVTWPGAPELCDGQDNDCDGQIDATEADQDGDGHRICAGDCDDGDPTVRPGALEVCDGGKDTDCDGVAQDYLDEDGDGWTLCASDCDDTEPLAHPTREEVCDGVDNDCNGFADDIDRDGDGRGACPGAGDCDDTDPDAYGQVVDTFAEPEGDGSTDAPYDDILDAIASLDDICRTVVLRRGTYEVSRRWRDGYLRIEGAGTYPDEVLVSPPVGTDYRVFSVEDGSILEIANLMLRQAQGSGSGGAVQSIESDLVLEDVVLFENTTVGDGGAVYVRGGSLRLDRVEVTANEATGRGGAVATQDAAVQITDSAWAANRSDQSGGALAVDGGAVVVEGGVFADNAALLHGGALDVASASQVDVVGVWLRENDALTGSGGAIHLGDVVSGVLTNLRMQDNHAAADGGGLAVTGAQAGLVIANITSAGDGADRTGGAFALQPSMGGDTVWVWSNLVLGAGGAAAVQVAEGAAVSVGWTTVWGADTAAWALGGAVDAGGNDTLDPLVVSFSDNGDALDDDLALQAGSPAVDSGPPAGAAAGALTVWSDPDGSPNDRGYTGGPAATGP